MRNIIRNTGRLLKRNKSFIFMVTVMPTLLFLLMSILLSYSEMHSIAVINNTDDKSVVDALNGIDGIEIQDIDEDKIDESIIQGTIELAVVINSDPSTGKPAVQIINTGGSEIYNAVELAAGTASESPDKGITSVNTVNRGIYNLGNTTAFMLYKFMEGGIILGTMIIMDRKRRVKGRIMLSGIKPVTYIGGITITYLIYSFAGTLIYYLTALIMNFDFGMKYSACYLLMICLANVFSASFYVFSSSFVKSGEVLESVSTFVLIPMAFFSGMFFPFKYMPEVFRTIASFLPQRWISHGIEQIQQTGKLSAALWDITLLVTLSAVLFAVGAIRNSKKACNI